jgi:hypothetical protein
MVLGLCKSEILTISCYNGRGINPVCLDYQTNIGQYLKTFIDEIPDDGAFSIIKTFLRKMVSQNPADRPSIEGTVAVLNLYEANALTQEAMDAITAGNKFLDGLRVSARAWITSATKRFTIGRADQGKNILSAINKIDFLQIKSPANLRNFYFSSPLKSIVDATGVSHVGTDQSPREWVYDFFAVNKVPVNPYDRHKITERFHAHEKRSTPCSIKNMWW